MSVPFWAEYARVQQRVEQGKARDEQLDALLKRYCDDGHPFDLFHCRRRLKNLDRNLLRKDRYRSALLKRNGHQAGLAPEPSPVAAAAVAEARVAVRSSAGADWSLLRESVNGEFAATARRMRIPVGTLKARVSRARAKLKAVLVRYAD